MSTAQKLILGTASAALLICSVAGGSADARELGQGIQYPPGLLIGIPTGALPKSGCSEILRSNYYSADVVNNQGNKTGIHLDVAAGSSQTVCNTGLKILGASWGVGFAQPFVDLTARGVPNLATGNTVTAVGFADPWIAPLMLSWNLGQGLFFGTSLGFYAPTGSYDKAKAVPSSPTGNIGDNFWTFEPSASISYLANGWNLTLYANYEINTKNTYTNFKSGDVLNIDLTATKKFGQWELGPVGYYTKQVTSDVENGFYTAGPGGPSLCSLPATKHVFCSNPERLALGALVGYDFGPVALKAYYTNDVFAQDDAKGQKIWFDVIFPFAQNTEPSGKPPIKFPTK